MGRSIRGKIEEVVKEIQKTTKALKRKRHSEARQRGCRILKKLSVSEVLNWANSVIYDDSFTSDTSDTVFTPVESESSDDCAYADVDAGADQENSLTDSRGSVVEADTVADLANTTMAPNKDDTSKEPTNADILTYLKKMDGKLSSVEEKMGKMDKRLSALEEMKVKVDGFDGELKKLWGVLNEQNKKTVDRMVAVEEKASAAEFDVAQWNSRLDQLQKDKDTLKDEVVYLQSQSMRNNLVFSNIPESADTIETSEVSEKKLRQFLHDKMEIAEDLVKTIKLERVHTMGQKVTGKHRKIVAKFNDFKDREMVRKQWKKLKNTPYYVNEQFPREVVEKRRKLVPRMKAARAANKKAWIAYDTLYIDGKAIRD